MVWTSPDGITWSRVPGNRIENGDGPGHQEMRSVIAAGPGLVAVGSAGFDGWPAAVWTSPDGITWSQDPYGRDIPSGEGGYGRMFSVTVGPSGLVAVGNHRGGTAAVWVSTGS